MKFENDYEIDKFINNFNKTIEIAIEHGGDSGGAYCSNEEELVKNLQNWCYEIMSENKEFFKYWELTVGFESRTDSFPKIIYVQKEIKNVS